MASTRAFNEPSSFQCCPVLWSSLEHGVFKPLCFTGFHRVKLASLPLDEGVVHSAVNKVLTQSPPPRVFFNPVKYWCISNSLCPCGFIHFPPFIVHLLGLWQDTKPNHLCLTCQDSLSLSLKTRSYFTLEPLPRIELSVLCSPLVPYSCFHHCLPNSAPQFIWLQLYLTVSFLQLYLSLINFFILATLGVQEC